jgi:antirestriction protein ArdC
VYARVTNHIVQAIERGAGEWKMPWHVRDADAFEPVNVVTKRPYRGINVLSLWASAATRGYESGMWGTYKQWRTLGAQVRRGETASPVVFWKVSEKAAETPPPGAREENAGQEKAVAKKVLLARGYSVFNLAQVDGFTPPPAAEISPLVRHAEAEKFLRGQGAAIRHGGFRAFFSPEGDYVQLPRFEGFHTAAGYYSTLAHELTHWTGARARLGRDLTGRLGSQAYAAEELVAELGAAFTMARLRLSNEPRQDHAAYIASWLELLKNDKRAIFSAASRAQEATDWMAQNYERQKIQKEPGNELAQAPKIADTRYKGRSAPDDEEVRFAPIARDRARDLERERDR